MFNCSTVCQIQLSAVKVWHKQHCCSVSETDPGLQSPLCSVSKAFQTGTWPTELCAHMRHRRLWSESLSVSESFQPHHHHALLIELSLKLGVTCWSWIFLKNRLVVRKYLSVHSVAAIPCSPRCVNPSFLLFHPSFLSFPALLFYQLFILPSLFHFPLLSPSSFLSSPSRPASVW